MAVPVISVDQMREWEKSSWAAGKTAADVIQEVGRKISIRLASLAHPGDKILFLAGRGHNGDDVRAALEQLPEQFVPHLINVTDPADGREKFLAAVSGGSAWIVDGLFGIGLDRPLDERWQELITTVNDSRVPVVSVDVPSGLNADTGGIEGAAIVADVTLTVGAAKRGLLKAPKHVGRLEVLPDVGLVPCPFEEELNWTLEHDFSDLPPRRLVESNKGSYGHLAICAGSSGYHGAAVLAGLGAARAQPGLITIFPQESVYVPVASQCQATMVHAWRVGQPLVKGCSALLFGPGLAGVDVSDAMKEELQTHWREAQLPVIADASALDWLPQGPTQADAVRVITPHPGEAGRMLGSSATAVQSDRVAALRTLSRQFGNCIVVLKGHQTLVGRASGGIFANCSGNPSLAQGGSGDLLGGYIAGLLAQPEWQTNPLRTVRFGVWQHGAAADCLSRGPANWTIEDLSRRLGAIMAK